jgi:hypothetical protein
MPGRLGQGRLVPVAGNRDLLEARLEEARDEEDFAAWAVRLQALAELRALSGADDRPQPPRSRVILVP